MNTLYFDVISGVSGNMILGALIDLGLSFNYLKEELLKLKLSDYELEIKKSVKHNITGTLFKVNVDLSKQPHRKFIDIENIINESSLSDKVKIKSLEIFKKIAIAEAKIHNTDLQKVHFHEIGAVDSIIDIVGAVIGFDYFNFDKIYSSKIVCGSGGLIKSSHGNIPNPPPAVLELLKNIPCKNIDIEQELTTPTGAAILSSVVDEFNVFNELKIKNIGYGLGEKDFKEIPNLLRVVTGDVYSNRFEIDYVSVIETNIDDMNPEYYDWLIDEALSKGALDIFLTPIIMKKSRAAVCVTILCMPSHEKQFAEFLLKNTTSFGVRITSNRREKIKRSIEIIQTKYGSLKVKNGYIDDKIVKISPEYEDVKRIAKETGVPPQEIVKEIIKKER